MQTFCRVAPSLGSLEGHPNDVWGTKSYVFPKDATHPTVFFGLYDLRDYVSLALHRGEAWVLWAGSDLRNLTQGFIFNDGKLRWLNRFFGNRWLLPILKKATHYVENEWEHNELKKLGIESTIVPSFLGKLSDYPISYQWRERPQVYLSTGKDREEEYGFETVFQIAPLVPECDFHLYGSDSFMWRMLFNRHCPNVIFHGRVPKSVFNNDIMEFQCGLRLNETDGFSEITAKSILRGQYPITRLKNPMIPHFDTTEELVGHLKSLKDAKEPNTEGRMYYLSALNQYPWVS